MSVKMDDFNFYLKFAKPLVLNLPDARDRTIAALWVKKLRDMNSAGPEGDMRVEYLKLLLFVMQRNKLAGIFEKAPPESLIDFPANAKATDMLFLVKPKRAAVLDYPPVFTSVGGDLCQFVAIQEIPNFGLHGYYAISTQPLSKWSHANTNAARKFNTITEQTKCFENTCPFIQPDFEKQRRCSPSKPPPPPPQSSGLQIQGPTNSKNEIHSKNTRKLADCEKLPTYTPPCVTLPSIPFQSFRTEIGGMESRPTWGRSRYIERLIDESPHLTADLESCQANAMLHVMSDKKFKRVDSSGNCLLSEKRRQVERMMDYPACAVDLGNMEQVKSDSSNTCVPKNVNTLDIPIDECLSDDDFYRCGKRSGESLRGGSDDGECCGNQRNTTRYPVTSVRKKFPQAHFDDSAYSQSEPQRYKNKSGACCGAGNNYDSRPSNIFAAKKTDSARHSKTERQAKLFDSIFADTNHITDVDSELQKTMAMRNFSNSDQFGNFKWLENMENIELVDPTDTSFNDSDSRTVVRSHSSELLANNFDELEMDECSETSNRLPLDEELQLDELMPQVSWKVHSSNPHHSHRSQPRSPSTSYCFDDGYHTQARSQKLASTQDCDDGISKMIVRRRISKSREATPHSPEIHETTCQWREIINQEPEHDQIYDPEYLEYMQAVRQNAENRYDAIHEDYDEQHDDIDPQSYSNYMLNQIPDVDPAQYTRDLFHPPEVPRSSGKVNPPLSAKYRRMQASEENRQRRSPKKKSGKSAEHINRT